MLSTLYKIESPGRRGDEDSCAATYLVVRAPTYILVRLQLDKYRPLQSKVKV